MKSRCCITILLLALPGLSIHISRGQSATDQAKELDQASELSAQVVKLYEAKKFEEALPLAKRALEIRQRLLPAGSPLIESTLINLGELYLVLKKDSEAEKTFQQALTVAESQTGGDQIAISRLLDTLAFLRIRKHDFPHADPFLLRSLEIKEEVLGPTHSQTIEAMKDYACLEISNRSQENPLVKDKNERRALLRSRAFCWLGELTGDCSLKAKVQTNDVMNGKALVLVTPGYPSTARAKHLSGAAFVAILIDREGNVNAARSVCGGYLELNTASVEAARRSKFSPTKMNNEPVPATGLIIYRFIAQ
jgi:TonB family protein